MTATINKDKSKPLLKCPYCGRRLDPLGMTPCDCGIASSPFGTEPVEIPVDGVLDLHTFRPSEISDLVPGFLQECAAKGILRVRIIHGKGSGALMKTLHAVLARTPGIESFSIADSRESGSGATIVRLHQDKKRST